MASNKLRTHLGDVENKMEVAGAGGVKRGVSDRLPVLLPQTTTGRDDVFRLAIVISG